MWYEGFEKACNTLMANMVPEYRVLLESINDRVVDLMVPFQKGWYVDRDFMGSASIKNVLPVIAPELSYKDMDISEGASAQRLWMGAVYDNTHDELDKDKLMESLRAYCELDTYAMVKIFEFLVALNNSGGYSLQAMSVNKDFEQRCV